MDDLQQKKRAKYRNIASKKHIPEIKNLTELILG